MSTIRINNSKREIVITKAFAKKAEQFKSDEYYELKEAKADNPTYKVVVRKAPKRDTLKGLNYDFMKQYIERHDDEDGTAMAEFTKMTVKDEDKLSTLSYGEVKKWFLAKYPAICEVA